MKILVLNGSPKGKNSVTLQTMLYLEARDHDNQYTFLDVGRAIKKIEKDFSESKEKLEAADLIVFAYPVYTFLVPYQLQRFIELIHEHQIDLRGKVATQVTTSKHFYDITAHKYIEANAYDLGMYFIKGLSADMEDLLCEKGRGEATNFWDYVLFCIHQQTYEPIHHIQEGKVIQEGQGGDVTTPLHQQYQATLADVRKKQNKEMVIVTNCGDDDQQLQQMIVDVRAALPYATKVFNVRTYSFSGGCLGCMGCSFTAKCVYKDGFDDYLRQQVQSADGIIYAFTLKNHYTEASFKMYDDRQFCNGHRAVTKGMPVAYLISGAYSKEPNLQMVIEARSEVGGNFLAYVATDEGNTQQEIIHLAQHMTYAYEHQLTKPETFYGVGGHKIFRDLIYLMRGMMKADHNFYKAQGSYDFPQKKWAKSMQMSVLGWLMQQPSVQKKMSGAKLAETILAPYQKVIEATKSKN